MGIDTEAPPATAIGYDCIAGTRKSAKDEVILFTSSVHRPPLFTNRGSSRNEPTQTLPKSPESAIPRTSRGAGAVPKTGIVCGPPGSLLMIMMFAGGGARLVG